MTSLRAAGVAGRLVLAAGAVGLLIWGPPIRSAERAVLLDGSAEVAHIASLLANRTAEALRYEDVRSPSQAVSSVLAAAAERGHSVTLVVPGDLPALRVVPPTGAIARRRAALGLVLRGDPGVTEVVISDGTGSADTVAITLDETGAGAFSVAVEPARAGVATWAVRAGSDSVTVQAWVEPAAPLRILALTEAPGWESRFVLRALEALGGEVEVHQALGRSLTVTSGGPSLPRTMAELDVYDVVAVFGTSEAIPRPLLRRWVVERGGGLLFVGTRPGPVGANDWSFGSPRTANASAIDWPGPVEILPLPPFDGTVEGFPLIAEAASPLDGLFAAADWLGRGRVYASGLHSWTWVMDGGLVREHQAHWESVVEWLAGGLRSDVELVSEAAPPDVPWVGWLSGLEGTDVIGIEPVEGDVEGENGVRLPGDAGAVTEALVEGEAPPDDRGPRSELIPLAPSIHERVAARFVPQRPGGYRLDGLGIGAVIPDPEARTTWVGAALRVGRAGATVAAASTDEPAIASTTPAGDGLRSWLLMLLLSSAALVGWATERLGPSRQRGT